MIIYLFPWDTKSSIDGVTFRYTKHKFTSNI